MRIKEIVKKVFGKKLIGIYHYGWAFLSAMVFGFPSKKLTVIGVTGTSGKSTTCDLITRILEEPFGSAQGGSGNKVASTSTIRFKIADKEWENKYKMSMPGRFVLQRFLKQAKEAGCKFVVLEVTSEGIKQFRHKFINFDTAVFTNLGREHLESHGGFENYRNEKLKLFKATKNVHVINADDKSAKYFLDIPAKKKIAYTLKEAEELNLNLKLPGEFNLYNAMSAVSVARVYGISLDTCRKALEKATGIPGRMELLQKDPFGVIVDYAHTPEQLESVYKTLNGNLVCVLGSCGGGRDKWKRPVLGEIAARYCKEIIITNEDPYDEDPLEIMEEVSKGIKEKDFCIVVDRKEAIKKAIDSAKPGDTVIITGKGSEPWMCVANGEKIPWDDRQIAKDFLKIKNK